nr:unnamed protein product [Spirometra erinaceieuropaei]
MCLAGTTAAAVVAVEVEHKDEQEGKEEEEEDGGGGSRRRSELGGGVEDDEEVDGGAAVEEPFGEPLVTPPHEMAARTQLQLSQHGVDAEGSRSLHCVRVRDLVQPTELQYVTKTSEVEVIESACLLREPRPSCCSIQQRRRMTALYIFNVVLS